MLSDAYNAGVTFANEKIAAMIPGALIGAASHGLAGGVGGGILGGASSLFNDKMSLSEGVGKGALIGAGAGAGGGALTGGYLGRKLGKSIKGIGKDQESILAALLRKVDDDNITDTLKKFKSTGATAAGLGVAGSAAGGYGAYRGVRDNNKSRR